MRFRAYRLMHRQRARVRRRRTLRRPLPEVVTEVRAAGLTYLAEDALLSLYDAVVAVETNGVPGCLVEAGCALGGSAIVMASSKSPGRPLWVYDVFGMIPPPSPRDGHDVHERYAVISRGDASGFAEELYYGYRDGLRAVVAETFTRFGLPPDEHAVSLVEGLFDDTLYPPGAVALAHIDGDWYDSVAICLKRILPLLSPGGVVIVDDYGDWSGAFDAVNDVARGLGREFSVSRWKHPRVRITRQS